MHTQIEIQDIIDAYLEHLRQGKSVPIQQLAAMFPEREQEIVSLLQVVEQLEAEADCGKPRLPFDFPRELLANYQIQRVIGSGGTGWVFEAVHAHRGKVALKLIPRSSQNFRIERFQREARILTRLHHSNIVPVFDFGVFEELCFISMQHVDGLDLSEIIRCLREGTVPENANHQTLVKRFDKDWKKIARLGFDVAKSIEYAHENSILHRDIKPANLMLDVDGKVWVTDFGLAKPNEPDNSITQSGRTVGTIRYMAPEQVNNTADHRSDLYCLGLTIYELAFPDSPSLKSPVTRHPLARPTATIPGFPKKLEDILLKACHPSPQKRFQSAREMATALGQFCDLRNGSKSRTGNDNRSVVVPFGLVSIMILVFTIMMNGQHRDNIDHATTENHQNHELQINNGYTLVEGSKPGLYRMSTKIASSLDDAEEGSYGKVDVLDTNLDMVWDGQSKTVGLRFRYVHLPANSVVRSAYIQFTSGQSCFGKTELMIHGEASNGSDEFVPSLRNISLRPTTKSRIHWQVPVWEKGDGGPKQRTPDISSIIRELMRETNRTEHDPVTFIISGSGRRCSVSFENLPELAPKLIVEYELVRK